MRWWRLVVLVCPLVMGGCQEESLQATRTPLSVKPLPAVDLPHSTSLHPGETLADMFGRLGLGEAEAALWVRQATTKLDPRRLPAWAPVVCYRLWGVELHELRLTLGWDELVLTKTGPGVVTAEVKKRPVTETVLLKGGAISGSLFGTVSAFGERDELAIALAEVFAWQVDFHRDLQPGDQVKVLFVRQESEGELLGYGPILAATLVNKGKEYRAFRYLHQGKAGYYDELGRPLKRQFLRSPLPYSRVTSGFSLSRRHPILGRRLPHFGVDYAAPEGTPVRATADGVVSFVGWKGGGGKTVEIRHAGGFTTAYLHLSRFASGLTVGRRVSQGEVIGYVGSTGLATGPHLDYRVTQNGRYLNPARIGSDPAPPLAGKALEAFNAAKMKLEAALACPAPAVLDKGELEVAFAGLSSR
ncbi:Murein DD-endopeptidase MepM [bacterium HR09]|nr:Murein DD-endopeptidase MepM [bacterium HR09]